MRKYAAVTFCVTLFLIVLSVNAGLVRGVQVSESSISAVKILNPIVAPLVPSGSIIASTFNIQENDTIALISGNGIITRKNSQLDPQIVEKYSEVVFNPAKREVYFIGFTSSSPFIHIYNADSLEYQGEVMIQDYFAFIDAAWDPKLNKVVAVAGAEAGFGIAAYDVETGIRTNIIKDMPNIEGVEEFCSVYDVANQRFYVAVLSKNLSAVTQYYQYNLATTKLERSIVVPDFPQNAVFDSKNNRIVGVWKETLTEVDLKTGKFIPHPTCNFEKIGFRELGAGAIDSASQNYYVLYENEDAQTTWIQADLQSFKYTTYPWYDHIGVMSFVPAK